MLYTYDDYHYNNDDNNSRLHRLRWPLDQMNQKLRVQRLICNARKNISDNILTCVLLTPSRSSLVISAWRSNSACATLKSVSAFLHKNTDFRNFLMSDINSSYQMENQVTWVLTLSDCCRRYNEGNELTVEKNWKVRMYVRTKSRGFYGICTHIPYSHFRFFPYTYGGCACETSRGFANLLRASYTHMQIFSTDIGGWGIFCVDLDILCNFQLKNFYWVNPSSVEAVMEKCSFLCRCDHFTQFPAKHIL